MLSDPSDLLVLIQHHPSRSGLLPRLVDGLGNLEHLVVADDADGHPDPWRGYRRCLEAAVASDAPHVAIIQDDAIPCFDFACWLRCRISAEPDAVLVLFLAASPRLSALSATQAHGAGEAFAQLHTRDFMPAVAVCWPAAAARSTLAWTHSFTGRHTRSDDHMLGAWHRESSARVLVTVPSLVQHPDDVPSLIGNGNGAHGRNPARTALHWDG